MGDCLDWMGRIPFASVVAWLLLVVGIGVCCGTLFYGLDIVVREIFIDIFSLECVFTWLDVLRWVFISIGVVMGVVSIVMLIFGCLATGATRKNIYTGTRCIMGGRVTAAFLMFISYVLMVVWLLAVLCIAVPTLFLVMQHLRCNPRIEFIDQQGGDDVPKEDCIYLNNFGFNLNATILHYDGWNGIPCDTRATIFICDRHKINLYCNKIGESYYYFAVSLGGALLVVLGLVQFMIALSANYFHISVSAELTEYRQAIDLQNRELEMSFLPENQIYYPPEDGTFGGKSSRGIPGTYRSTGGLGQGDSTDVHYRGGGSSTYDKHYNGTYDNRTEI